MIPQIFSSPVIFRAYSVMLQIPQWEQPVIPDEVYEEVRRKWLAGEPG